MSEAFFAYILYVLIGSMWLFPTHTSEFKLPVFEAGVFSKNYVSGTAIFTGDIFLGRKVERIGTELGMDYSFREVRSLLRNADITIGNFEASIPQKHIPTPDLTFRFSVKESYLPLLKDSGFDILSFANNHAYDYGSAGYDHGLLKCAETEIVCKGHPYELSENSYATTSVGTEVLGILFIHGPHIDINATTSKEIITRLEAVSDIQIAFVHWGNEYEKVHDDKSEVLAHALIDQGIDGIIGHHPHVVQDFEVYSGKFIAYSLGNFIFDQYFSYDVQRGLVLKLSIDRETVTYELIPISSLENQSQPKPMNKSETTEFMKSLRITGFDSDAFIANGGVTLAR